MSIEFKKKCDRCKKEFKYVLKSWNEKEPEFCDDTCEQLFYEELEEKRRTISIKNNMLLIPKKYRNLKTDRTQLLDKCVNTNLYIHGKCGTGKSIFISNLAIKYILNGTSIAWIETLDFFQKMRVAYSNNESIEEEVQHYCYFDGVLFINDFGTSNKEFVKMQLLTLLDAREKNELLTVITSNLKVEEIQKQFGERILSRIIGMNIKIKINDKGEKQKVNTIYLFKSEDRRYSPEKWSNNTLEMENIQL